MFCFIKMILLGSLFFSLQANADYLSCDLKLGLIENTDSSEEKKLFFEIELPESGRNRMDGSMNVTSCFGTSFYSFSSDTTRVYRYIDQGMINGGVNDTKVKIGSKYFKFNLKFKQKTESLLGFQNDNLMMSGKIIPMDDDYFIHQIATGDCRITKQRMGIFGFLDRASDFVINFKNNKGRMICH